VRIFLDRRAFAHWSTKVHAWRVTAGRYTIRVGGSSAQLPLHASVLRGAAPA
jgi:beta-glucosidase